MSSWLYILLFFLNASQVLPCDLPTRDIKIGIELLFILVIVDKGTMIGYCLLQTN